MVFKALNSLSEITFAKTLKHLQINAMIIKSENENTWVQENQPVTVNDAFQYLNNFILKCDNLESLELIGMSIVDHLEDLIMAVKRPKLKKLSIPYNGITSEFCECFQHMFNFKTLEELNLSSNWFGMTGLQRFKSQFAKFDNLQVLHLASNKLCNDEGVDTRQFRDALF